MRFLFDMLNKLFGFIYKALSFSIITRPILMSVANGSKRAFSLAERNVIPNSELHVTVWFLFYMPFTQRKGMKLLNSSKFYTMPEKLRTIWLL